MRTAQTKQLATVGMATMTPRAEGVLYGGVHSSAIDLTCNQLR